MSFVLETLNSPTLSTILDIVNKFELSDNKRSSCYDENEDDQIEKSLLNTIINRAIDKKSKIHILYDNRDLKNPIPCALLALNFETIGGFFALSVDYIFVSKSYRSIYFEELDSKISFYLLKFVVEEAISVNNITGLDAIILTPINKCVEKIYLEFGFIEFVDDWLFMPIENINNNSI